MALTQSQIDDQARQAAYLAAVQAGALQQRTIESMYYPTMPCNDYPYPVPPITFQQRMLNGK